MRIMAQRLKELQREIDKKKKERIAEAYLSSVEVTNSSPSLSKQDDALTLPKVSPFLDSTPFTTLHNSLYGQQIHSIDDELAQICKLEYELQTQIADEQITALKHFLTIRTGSPQEIQYVDKEWMKSNQHVSSFLGDVKLMFGDTAGKFRSTSKSVDSIHSITSDVQVTRKKQTRSQIRNSYRVQKKHKVQQPLKPNTLYVYKYKGLPRVVLRFVPKVDTTSNSNSSSASDSKKDKDAFSYDDLSPTWKYILTEAKRAFPDRSYSDCIHPMTWEEWLEENQDHVKVLTQYAHQLDYVTLLQDFNLYVSGGASRVRNIDMSTLPTSINVLDHFELYGDASMKEYVRSGEWYGLLREIEQEGMTVNESEKVFANPDTYVLNVKKYFLRRFQQEIASTGMTPLTDELLNIMFVHWNIIVTAEPKLQVIKDDLLKYYSRYGVDATFDYNMKRSEMKVVTRGHLLAHKVLECALSIVETIYTYDIQDETFKDILIDLGRLIMRDPIYGTTTVRDATTVMKQLMYTQGTQFRRIMFKKYDYSNFNEKLVLKGEQMTNEPPTLLATTHYEEMDKKRIDALIKANQRAGNILSQSSIERCRYTDSLDLVGDANRYFSALTTLEAVAGFASSDLLSGFIDSNESIEFTGTAHLRKLLYHSVREQITTLNTSTVPRPSLPKVLLSSAKDTASASIEPLTFRIYKTTPEYDGESLNLVESTVEMSTRQKKPNLMKAAEILRSTVTTNQEMIISGGTRAVQGGKGARAVYPTKQPYHIAGSLLFHKVDTIVNANKKYRGVSNKYGQGISNAIPHIGVPEIIAVSSDGMAICLALDVSAFDVAQKYTEADIELAMRDGFLDSEISMISGETVLERMNPADLANNLLTNTPPRYKYQTALGDIIILQHGNRSGVPWTGTQNDLVNVSNHHMAYDEYKKRVAELQRQGKISIDVNDKHHIVRVFGDDSTFIMTYDEPPSAEEVHLMCATFVESYQDTAGTLGFAINARKGMIGRYGSEYLKNSAIYGNIKSVNQVKFRGSEKSASYHFGVSEKVSMIRDITDLTITRGCDETRKWKYNLMMLPVDLTTRAGAFRMHNLCSIMTGVGKMYLGGTLNNKLIASYHGSSFGWNFDDNLIKTANSIGAISDSSYDAISTKITNLADFKDSQQRITRDIITSGRLPQHLNRYGKSNILRHILASAAMGPLSQIEKNVNAYNVVMGILNGKLEAPTVLERLNMGFKYVVMSDLKQDDYSPYSCQGLQYRRMLVHWGLNDSRITSFDPKGKLQHLLAKNSQILPIHFDIEFVYRLYLQAGTMGFLQVMSYYQLPDTLTHEMLAAVVALELQLGNDKYAVDMGVYSSQAGQIRINDALMDSIIQHRRGPPLPIIDRTLNRLLLHTYMLMFGLMGKSIDSTKIDPTLSWRAILESNDQRIAQLSELLTAV
uniref:RNA-directed RNA polymerase n=1 Tax=Scylla paramamosain reovirus TaxID=1226329 RepID=A0AA96NLV0_9REOV|nr:VP1 [Scylla paramamosain reovirus]